MATAASSAIGAKPAATACNSLSGQLITNIDMSVCAQGVKEPGRAFPTPTCHYLAPQFAPPILCHFLVGRRVKTNSLHSVLTLKSIHLSKQGFLSPFGARLIPESDSVHLSVARKVSSEINHSQSIIIVILLCVCLLFQGIPLAGLVSSDEALLVLHQLQFYPVFIIFEGLQFFF